MGRASNPHRTGLRAACMLALALAVATGATAYGRVAGAGRVQGSFGCLQPPTMTPAVPADAELPEQAEMNCFAWQEFIALNWAADTSTCAADTSVQASQFGEPGDMDPVVWETYKLPEEVFLPDAAPPAPWCDESESPAGSDGAGKVLSDVTPFVPGFELDLSAFDEVAPSDAWITSREGFLTFVEIRMNEDEFEYIVEEQLYDGSKQAAVAESTGIQLPSGAGDTIGSIELKATWVHLPDESMYPFFKTREAYVQYPGEPPPTEPEVVGLVGLHIIHKTESAQQFVWATFEHRWNAPDANALPSPSASPYNYYNPACDPSTDHYKCKTNVPPKPPIDPYDAPVQIVRENVIPSESTNDVVGLNESVWGMIGDANPDSVFLNYQLVNVLWPQQSTPIGAGATIPLTKGDMQPVDEKVANTTLETYAQSLTCLDCHVAAPIATPTPSPGAELEGTRAGTGAPVYAADYSFLLRHAQFPPGDESGSGSGTPLGLIAAAAAAAAAAAGVGVAVARRRSRSG